MSGNPLAVLLDNIDRLTKPIKDPVWQDVWDPVKNRVTGRELAMVNRAGLLVQLRAAIASSVSTPANPVRGGGALLGGLNVAAFTKYEEIDGRVRAAWKELHQPSSKDDPEVVLRRWYVHIRNLHESGQVPDSFVSQWVSITAGWVRSIEAMFNPPVVKELVGPCPNCEATHASNKDGEQTHAMYLHYTDEQSPEAVCRLCGWNVSGERGLLELGFHIGATVDEDALREMGVIG